MSQYGEPPDEPGPDQEPSGAAGAPPPDPEPADPPPADQGGEKPWSPYPENWETFATAPQPAATYGKDLAPPEAQPGTPPPNPYGDPAAGSAPDFAFGGFASWLSRVGAYLIDSFAGSIAGFPLWVGYLLLITGATTTTDPNGVEHVHLHQVGASLALILIGSLSSLAFSIWNLYVRQGRTGASVGKSVLGLRLVNEDLQPIGAVRAFVRNLLHVVDSLPCGFGYLWPIWDSRKQTFADKLMGTVVIYANKPQPRAF
jgi:uncharacterized RDD family membrane protein YckC